MKVDTQSFDSAYIKLRELQQRLQDVDHQMNEAGRVLNQYGIGGTMTTELITNSLNSQIRSMEQKMDSVDQLAGVIQEVAEEYRNCETLNRYQSGGRLVFQVNGKFYELPNDVRYLQPVREKAIIDQYIMPLITTGK